MLKEFFGLDSTVIEDRRQTDVFESPRRHPAIVNPATLVRELLV